MKPDAELLTRYATQRDETAFAELVRRHLDHVYSTALRLVGGDPHLAEDVAQTVFTDLARKAGSLRECPALSGWLHASARFAATKVVRAEQRRRQREQTTLAMPATSPASEPDWEQVRSFLDETIGELSDPDRDALLLRYFEKKPFAEIGTALGLSENAARMRVDRAIEKLRARLAMRGITSTAAALGTALAQHAVGTAPAALGARIVSHALAGGSLAGVTSTSWLGSLTPVGKLALVTATALVVGMLALVFWPAPSAVTPKAGAGIPSHDADATAVAAASADTLLTDKDTVSSETDASTRHGLELLFVDAATGLAITNQVLGLRGWERDAQLLVEKRVSLEAGQCLVPFEADAKPSHGYWVLTHADGYADVRLRWQPSRGDMIPESYTVRLVRPALIHGQVVDAVGNPVAGATVGFNTENTSAQGLTVEDHCIDYLTATTDTNGCWQIRRIAPEMVRRLFGSASHPDYSRSETISVSRQPELAQQLLDGTLVFHLGEGISVRGVVVDGSGQPIANADVHVGHLGDSRSRGAQTGSDGSFRVSGCQPGEGIISAEADGFAPAALSLKLDANLQRVQLTLGPGRPLRLRVLDPAGRPVAGARVFLDSFPRSERRVPIPQVYFRRDTDLDGRVVWINAPDQELEFGVTASGYMRVGVWLRPVEQEHIITLSPALVINGTVRDSVTGDLIPRFRLGTGWPEQTADGAVQPRWSDIDRFWLTFTGGEFRHSLEETVSGDASRGYVFRFEAEGHAPFVTRVYQADEGEVRLEVQLRSVLDIAAVTYTPDGRVASGAQVGLVAPGSDLHLVPGGFAGDLGYALAWLRRADAAGRFVVPDDESVQRVVIAHPEGYAEVTLGELRKARTVRLDPWARVDGLWQVNGQPVTNGEVRLQWSRPPVNAPALDSFLAHTDANGHFAFAQIPPGTFELQTWQTGSEGRAERDDLKATTFDARSGETNQVFLGDARGSSVQ